MHRGEGSNLYELWKVDLGITEQAPGKSEQKMFSRELASHEDEGGKKDGSWTEGNSKVGLNRAEGSEEEAKGESQNEGQEKSEGGGGPTIATENLADPGQNQEALDRPRQVTADKPDAARPSLESDQNRNERHERRRHPRELGK